MLTTRIRDEAIAILNHAEGLLIPGFCRGVLHTTVPRRVVLGLEIGKEHRYCMNGALNVAASGIWEYPFGFRFNPAHTLALDALHMALFDTLPEGPDTRAATRRIAEWNNAGARTHAEILSAYQRARAWLATRPVAVPQPVGVHVE